MPLPENGGARVIVERDLSHLLGSLATRIFSALRALFMPAWSLLEWGGMMDPGEFGPALERCRPQMASTVQKNERIP
jgi:hypothetical protein